AAVFGLSALLALEGLGFLSSFGYSFAFGLDSTYLNEGPLDWLRWGLKSMVAPMMAMIAVSIVALLLAEIVSLVRKVSSPTDQKLRETGAALTRAIVRAGLMPSSVLTWTILALASTYDVWMLGWQFADLFSATLWPID